MQKLSLLFVLIALTLLLGREGSASALSSRDSKHMNLGQLDHRRAAKVYQNAYKHYMDHCAEYTDESGKDPVEEARLYAKSAVSHFNETGDEFFDKC